MVFEFSIKAVAFPVAPLCPKALSARDLGKRLILTGIPNPDSLSRLQIQIRNVHNIEAITGGADVCTVAAGQATVPYLLPYRVIETLVKQDRDVLSSHVNLIVKDDSFLSRSASRSFRWEAPASSKRDPIFSLI